MPMTLRDLLERLRPAGAPGAPNESDASRREAARSDEVHDLVAQLGIFEAEAAEIVGEAEATAARITTEAQDRARNVRATIAERVAVAEAEGAGTWSEEAEAEATDLARRSDEEIAARRRHAESVMPELVRAVIDRLYDELLTPASEVTP